MLSWIQASSLIYKMVSGVKQHMLDNINSILIDQMDIASDSDKSLIGSSKRKTLNGAVRYFACGFLDCQCGVNV